MGLPVPSPSQIVSLIALKAVADAGVTAGPIKELAVQDAMLSSCSVLSGSPMKVVFNHEGKVDEVAVAVLGAIGL